MLNLRGMWEFNLIQKIPVAQTLTGGILIAARLAENECHNEQ